MRLMSTLCALAAAGCATADAPPDVLVGAPVPGGGMVVEGEAPPAVRYQRVVHPGDAALSVVGTPFLLAFKGVICAASVVVAAPVAALATIAEDRRAGPTTATLGDGLAANCGPPYVISPYRYVPVEATLAPEPERPPPT